MVGSYRPIFLGIALQMTKRSLIVYIQNIFWLAAVLAVAQYGCGSHGIHQAATHVKEHGITAISYPETHRVAFLKRNDDIEHLCAGGGIDAVSSTIGGSSLNVSGLVGEDEKIARTKETVESGLGGRDPVVLIARELLYRTCETAMNLELNTEQSLDLYKTTLQAIQSIAESHSNDGTSSDAAQMLNLPSNE